MQLTGCNMLYIDLQMMDILLRAHSLEHKLRIICGNSLAIHLRTEQCTGQTLVECAAWTDTHTPNLLMIRAQLD